MFAMQEEISINKEKCSTLHQNFNVMHENSHHKIHVCEKEIEIKIMEIKQLKEKLNSISDKMEAKKKNY